MPNPNIVLSDKDGNPIAYEGVNQIKVPGYGWDGEDSQKIFTRLPSLNAYFVKDAPGGYLVMKYLGLAAWDQFCTCLVSEADCREFGDTNSEGVYRLRVIYSTKNLSVGNVYSGTEL